MSSLILLLCSLPPLAVLAVAVVHGLRTRSPVIASALILSVLILSTAIIVPLVDDPETDPGIRFDTSRYSDRMRMDFAEQRTPTGPR